MLSFTEALTYKGGGIIRYLYDKVKEMDDRHEEAGFTYKTKDIILENKTTYYNGSWNHELANPTFVCPMPNISESDTDFDFQIVSYTADTVKYKYKSNGTSTVKLTVVKI